MFRISSMEIPFTIEKTAHLPTQKVDMYSRHFYSGCLKSNFSWYPFVFCQDQLPGFGLISGCNFWTMFLVPPPKLHEDEPNLTNMFRNFRLVSQPPSGGLRHLYFLDLDP